MKVKYRDNNCFIILLYFNLFVVFVALFLFVNDSI